MRFLYFFCYQNFIVITNVFDKHTKKVPLDKINLTKENRTDFLNRYTGEELRRFKS